MNKDDLVYIGHMLDTATKACSFVEGIEREDYDEDEQLRIALAHLLQIIGEAARRVSESFRLTHPELPWKQIVGMRNKVVHDYMYIDEDVVWETVLNDLPALLAQLEALMPPDENS
ncbi:MAG TPA: DUF86 domain-containing protein [Phototrophicaceae bacterium]|nr:DUF86 domain-containing protein [Phototrophicaceae bacterium]